MKYEVTVAGRVFEVDVEGETVTVGGQTLAARLVTIPGTPLCRVSANGVSRTFAITRTTDGWTIQRDGRAWAVGVADERTRSIARMVGTGKKRPDSGIVRAPMPGLVVRLEVEEGQRVAPGTGLLVLEAMKMENEIRATTAGVVKRVLVRAKQVVEKGTELIEIVPEQG